MLERAAAAATEASSGKAAAAESATSTEARSAGTGSGSGDEDLVHVGRHAVHRTGKEKRTEADVAIRRNVPTRRVFDYSVERLRPVMLDAEDRKSVV